MPSDARRRVFYGFAAAVVAALGLLWRSQLFPLSPFPRKYGGDALWALLVFYLVCFCRPRMRLAARAGLALGIAAVVEFSQLYHAPWIDSIRTTRLGMLILGSFFNWPDLPAYALGILIGAVIERIGSSPRRALRSTAG